MVSLEFFIDIKSIPGPGIDSASNRNEYHVFPGDKKLPVLRVFENRVLRRVFGPKRNEVTGEWRKLHNEKLRNLSSLPNIVRVVKSRRMR